MARRRIVYGALLLAAALFQIYSDHYLAGFVFALAAALPWVSLLLSLPAMLSCEVRVSPYHPAARRGETSWWLLDVGNRRRMPVARISIRMQMRNCMTGDGRRARLKLSGGSQGLHLAEPADLATAAGWNAGSNVCGYVIISDYSQSVRHCRNLRFCFPCRCRARQGRCRFLQAARRAVRRCAPGWGAVRVRTMTCAPTVPVTQCG